MKILKSYLKATGMTVLLAMTVAIAGCSGASGSNSEKKTNNMSSAGQLRDFLKNTAKKGIMLGHQDDLAYGSTWHGNADGSDMRDVSGDYPAVFGWDISGIESGGKLNRDSVAYDEVRKYIIKADDLNGISSVRWDGDSFIVSDDNSKNAILDKLAEFLSGLKNENGNTIPVIFQPLPAVDDSTGSEKYMESWIYLHEYLAQKGVDNVLYSFTVTDKIDFSTYPGDKYVDIIGLESLFADGCNDISEIDKTVTSVSEFAKKRNKMAAISAIGLKGIKEPCFFTKDLLPAINGKGIVYVILWKNSWKDENYCHLPVKGHPAADDFIKFVETKDILTLKDITR